MREIAEVWYGVTMFTIVSCSLGVGHSATDAAVVHDFLSRDRWGLGVNERPRVKNFHIFADYTDHFGGSAAALLPHLQQLATITSVKARIGIEFTSGQFDLFWRDWRNKSPFLQGLSIILPILDQLLTFEHGVVVGLENQHQFKVKSDELTVIDWTREFRKVFLP
jgi:hypothetical protein